MVISMSCSHNRQQQATTEIIYQEYLLPMESRKTIMEQYWQVIEMLEVNRQGDAKILKHQHSAEAISTQR